NPREGPHGRAGRHEQRRGPEGRRRDARRRPRGRARRRKEGREEERGEEGRRESLRRRGGSGARCALRLNRRPPSPLPVRRASAREPSGPSLFRCRLCLLAPLFCGIASRPLEKRVEGFDGLGRHMVRCTRLHGRVDEQLLAVRPCDHLLDGPERHDDVAPLRAGFPECLHANLSEPIALEGFRDSPLQLVVAHRDSIPELRGSYERYVSRIAIGSAGVNMHSWASEYARQTSLHSHARSSNSCRRPRENSSMALTTLRSHDPQLWAPRTMPPAVGWDFTWAWRFLVLSRTSTTDHNQGGRY